MFTSQIYRNILNLYIKFSRTDHTDSGFTSSIIYFHGSAAVARVVATTTTTPTEI